MSIVSLRLTKDRINDLHHFLNTNDRFIEFPLREYDRSDDAVPIKVNKNVFDKSVKKNILRLNKSQARTITKKEGAGLSVDKIKEGLTEAERNVVDTFEKIIKPIVSRGRKGSGLSGGLLPAILASIISNLPTIAAGLSSVASGIGIAKGVKGLIEGNGLEVTEGNGHKGVTEGNGLFQAGTSSGATTIKKK